jgi:hypothetical protein
MTRSVRFEQPHAFDEGELTVQFLADFTQRGPCHVAITGAPGNSIDCECP